MEDGSPFQLSVPFPEDGRLQVSLRPLRELQMPERPLVWSQEMPAAAGHPLRRHCRGPQGSDLMLPGVWTYWDPGAAGGSDC